MKRNYQKEFVGKRFMKNKRVYSILIAALIVGLAASAVPTMAGELNSVYGYLTINDDAASSGVTVKLILSTFNFLACWINWSTLFKLYFVKIIPTATFIPCLTKYLILFLTKEKPSFPLKALYSFSVGITI